MKKLKGPSTLPSREAPTPGPHAAPGAGRETSRGPRRPYARPRLIQHGKLPALTLGPSVTDQ
jgi:hypothetical protein